MPRTPLGMQAMSLAVVGADHPNRDKSNRRFELLLCAPGEPVWLRPEPKNAFDENAIAVFSARGVQIGYIKAERAPLICMMIREGRRIECAFQELASFGGVIRVAFDGETPELPAARPAPAEVRKVEQEWWPDEEWPD